MQQPPGYANPDKPTYVCKLKKAIYGLKQAPRAWNNTLKTALLGWGFNNSRSVSSLFIYKGGQFIILLLVYVDDVILIGNSVSLIDKLISALDSWFALKDLGRLSYFLGIQVEYIDRGLHLNQSKYVSDLLLKLNMGHLKPAPTPSVLGTKLSLTDGTPMTDPFIYRSTIGALQYLTNTRPDICYIVNHLSQFLQRPTDVHWQAVKRVLRYLTGPLSVGLLFQPDDILSLTAFSDADWASNIDDRLSVAGYCVFLGRSLVSCSSKKKSVVARSSTESEYRALAHAAAEITWLRQLLYEIGVPIRTKPVLWCDNMSAGALATNPVFHACTKHIEIDVHFVRDQVLRGDLTV
ncbi:MAG: reverse transcriptase domain-containing protein, partial [Sweet potato little leaf phytoplasma]|nr:reverse transcriptase domain-containing protein [Sweet potato little leaf phytoplasma]